MKVAVSGKGGVGKSTVAAALSLLLAEGGHKVLAVDADPDANLADALGLEEVQRDQIVPISERIALIEERTGARVNQYGQIFKLNPEVSDIADKYTVNVNGVSLLVLGAVKDGGAGCACPENVLIRALVSDLTLRQNESLIMDMEAGIEHLGRATAAAVDAMIVVVEPGRRAVDTAARIRDMAETIGIRKILYIGNKVIDDVEETFLRSALPGQQLLGLIPFSELFRAADRRQGSVMAGLNDRLLHRFKQILVNLESHLES